MAERDFNNVEMDDVIASFEDKFTFVENKAAPVIRKIIERQSLQILAPMEEATLHMFCILQHLRSKIWRLN